MLTGTHVPGSPNGQERLIAAGIRHALAERKIAVDAILHGAFVDTDMKPGEISVADLWKIIPYENMIVTATLNREQLIVVLEEGLKRAGSDVSRAKLAASLEKLFRFESRVTPTISYGPNRRVGALGAHIVTVDLGSHRFRPTGHYMRLD